MSQAALAGGFTMIHSAVVGQAGRIIIRPALRNDRIVEGDEFVKFKEFLLLRSKPSWNPCLSERGAEAVIPEYRLIIEAREVGGFVPLVEFSVNPGCFAEGEKSYTEFKRYVHDNLGIDPVETLWGK